MHQYQKYNLLIDSSKRFNQSESNTDFNVNLQNSYKNWRYRVSIDVDPM